jgi:GNAT superfamily N-acetyltransferase
VALDGELPRLVSPAALTRTILSDADGVVGRYDRDERDGHVYADLFDREPGVSVERAARAVLAELRGMRIAADEALGRALVAAGGTLTRHGHLMSHDLAERPAWREPPGYRLTDVDRPAADLVDAYRAAFPPGHVDHRGEPPEQSLAELESHLSGRAFGPLLAGSGLAIAPDDAVAGAILLGTLPGEPPLNGPWLIEVFRHPRHRGVGRALVERALALTDAPVLGLIVSEGNPARRLYEDLGFRLVSTRLVVQL